MEAGGYEDGRWRWILYDTDAGFEEYEDNTLLFAMSNNIRPSRDEEDKDILNRWVPLEKLLENDEFKEKFLSTFNDYLDTIFDEENVIKKIDEMAARIEPEIDEHFSRWRLKENFIGVILNKIKNEHLTELVWKDEVEKLKIFAINRPSYIRKYLDEYFKE